MRNIWLISDTHFGHERMLVFTDDNGNLIRGSRFSNVEEMNECMFDGWNETVGRNDIVFHLGDLMLGRIDKTDFVKRFKSLPGDKQLIVGNHDKVDWIVQEKLFNKVRMWKQFHEQGIIATHIPVHESSLNRYDKETTWLNAHGHIHQYPAPSEFHRCVCVEWTDYKPIHIEDVASLNNYVGYVPPLISTN